ncbi:hypothetical protein niasHT_026630 [Heterodera trifolii]|uniref:polynucleotide adenylyltransferase n=1 Tax=Heterodera trifolii TaxID=157864 RepID=A0ABD2KSC9_9BILA
MDQNLKLQLEAAIFYSNAKEMVNLRQDGKPKKVREQNANTLKVLAENFTASSTVSLVNLCHLWKFWRTLGDTLVENPKIQKNVKNYLKNRDQIDLNGVQCDESIGRNRVFVRDTALANFSSIVALLQLQNGKRTIKFGIDEEFRVMDLSNFFNDKRAKSESNFSFQLRRLRSMDKNKLIIRMKDKLRELIGPFFMTKLELMRPVEMNFDIVGDNELALDYAKFLSQEHLVEEKAITKIFVRIIFGRIMQIFARISAIWETPNIKMLKKSILNLWHGKELQMIHTDLKMPGLKAVTKYFEFYLELLRIFNSSQGIGEQEEQIGIVADQNIRQIYMEFAAKNKMFEMAWVALIEDNAKNILRLTESTTTNAFTALLKDSVMKEKGTKAKLNGFFTNNTERGDEIYEALAKKYPKLKQLISREELSDDQIRQLQIRNYIRFLNVTSSRNESMKSRFKLNLLLYYQWVKQMRDDQSSAEGKKEFDAKMGQIEISMDLVADENMAIEAYLVTVEANIMQEIEQFKQNKFLVNNGTPMKRHKEKVDELMEESPKFGEALKDIFVHETRMLKFGIDNPKVMERIKNKTVDTNTIIGKSDEQNCTTKQREEAEVVTTTEEEEKAQMETLRDQYVQMMKEKDPIIMMHFKDSVIKNAAYFQCKQWLKMILQMAQEKANKTNAKFKWVGQRTEFVLADVQQKEKQMAHGQFKAEKICEMAHLITHIHSHLNSAEKWKEIADKNGITAFVEQLNLIAITAETEMDKPKCDDQWVIKQVLNNLGTSPTQEEIHMRIMAHLIETNVPFFDFMHQSATNLPHSLLSEYEVEQKMHQTKINEVQGQLKNEFSNRQINEFYGPQMVKKAQKMNMPELIGQIVEHAQIFSKYTAAVCQKAAEPYAKMANAKAELFAMLKAISPAEMFRFICPLLRYVQFLNNQKTAQIWHTPYECFSAKFGQIFDEQLSLLADGHFIFLAEYLLKCEKSDEILHILRQKDGALLALNDLVGGHVKMLQIWAMPSVRQKLINKNYIFVWHNRMESKLRSIGGANGQQFADFLYFYCRIFNDSLSTEIARETSFMFSSFVDETFKFVEKMEKKKLDDSNFEIALAEMIHSVREKGKLGWIESGDKFSEPIEAIKAMHFAELNKFLTNKKKQRNLDGTFAAILADLAKNKRHQQNLLQILTMNDAKTFLEMANINSAKDPNFEMSLIEVKREEKAAKNRRKKEKNKLKKQMLMNNNNNNDNTNNNERNDENDTAEENEEIDQNPSADNETILSTIIEEFNDYNGTKYEESNGNDEEIENDELNVEHNSAEKISINISALNEFRNETFLHEKYEEYFENENANETKFLLDAGIFVFELQKHSAYDSNEIEKLLNEKRIDGLNLRQFDKRITTALSKINALIDKWSNGHARVGISGSLLLGTHTADSDVDLICIVPGQTMGLKNFFGNKNATCEKNKCSDGSTDSLYCKLCENKSVAKLLKLMHSSIFLIKFHMDNVEIDITFVAIPGKSVLRAELNEQMLTDYMNSLTNEKEEHKKMLRTISSYRSTLYIATLFLEKRIFNSKLTDFLKLGKVNCQNDNKNLENLRFLILSIKLWAKNNFIYANRYGYLNGIMTSIMATKIVLLYQNASFNFLLEKFFLFYSLRPQKVPLQLEKMLADSKFDQFTPTKGSESPLSILTPIFPAQNAAQLVTTASARIIHEQMMNELNKIKRMGTEAFNLEELLKDSLPFIEKFDDFILINCFSTSEATGEKFCRFVEGRLRLQIAYDIEIYETKTQLLNKIYTETCSTIHKFITSSFRSTYCNAWLIGINLRNENANDLNYALSLFDYRIKRDYLKYNYAKVSADGSAEKSYKAMKAEEIEEKLEQLTVGLKSLVTNREGLTV